MKIKPLIFLAAAAIPYFAGCATLPPELDRAFTKACRLEKLKEPVTKIGGLEISEDYWQTPKETEKRGGGDCEDRTIDLISELEKEGINAKFIVGKIYKNDPQDHAWGEVNYWDGNRYVLDTNGWWEINPPKTRYIRREMYPSEKAQYKRLEERIANGE